MAAKRYWPLISAAVLVWALTGWIGIAYRDELRWAADELPRYLSGSIGVPDERRLYRRAKRLIEEGHDLERARGLLERSIAIDPYSDAVYWMAEYHAAVGDEPDALDHYLRYLAFDPTRVEAYTSAAAILERQGRRDEARRIVERGLTWFDSRQEGIRPRPDPEVGMRYNQKAVEIHAYGEAAVARLSDELRRLDGGGDPSAAGGP